MLWHPGPGVRTRRSNPEFNPGPQTCPREIPLLLRASVVDNLQFNIITRKAVGKFPDVPRTSGASQTRVAKLNGGHYLVQDQIRLCFSNQERRNSHEEAFYIDVGDEEEPDPTIDVFISRDSKVLSGLGEKGKHCAPVLPKFSKNSDEKKAKEKKLEETMARADKQTEKLQAQQAEKYENNCRKQQGA
ncbi:hypothetical protein P170DRAFT_427731 [Aspergillus steynii IBT 23096]|uniref:Uncharacterized protein n=1 Tax=Aspergillus steynii IBT 23096 TaxID=1392250 RepID=A0A2I2G0K0_9EURO|nr:uncharacterized protein P170DRAFT_427731 [Aspergillus steynii IBT 23096]PLB46410.1 hypothetical protein P170DRAFT_427731 [Aspergillus steynii IBT 23096]